MRLSLALAIGAGALLHAFIFLHSFFKAPDRAGSFIAGVLVFSLASYAVAALLAFFWKVPLVALGFTVGILAGDLYLIYSVFIAPRGSMSGYFFLLIPAVNLFALGPLGALVFWIGAKLMNGRPE